MGLGPEWRIERMDEDSERQEARVVLARDAGSALRCPECGRACPGYDARRREWRGLDAWGYKTFVVYDVPRVECPEHGVVTTRAPWAEGRSRCTAAFESLALGWLREASVLAVSRRLSVDETSFKRGHRYVTVVSDSETKAVLHVAPGRGREALEAFCRRVGKRRLAAVESVSMDMWRPYVAATEAWVAGARRKTAFDRFHVAKHLGDAGGQGAARRAQGAAGRRQRRAGGHVLAVAPGSWQEDARREAGVRRAAQERRAHVGGLGAQAGCNGRRPAGSRRSRRRRRWSGRTCGASSTPSS